MSKKALILLAVVAVAVGLSVGAYAYFSNAGSGSGSASVGTSSGILLSNELVGNLYPGGADVPVVVNISNPGEGAQYVGTISGAVEDNGGCLGSWFEVDSINYNASLDPGASDSANSAIRMLDNGDNQDVCKNKVMSIDWSSN